MAGCEGLKQLTQLLVESFPEVLYHLLQNLFRKPSGQTDRVYVGVVRMDCELDSTAHLIEGLNELPTDRTTKL